MQRSQAIFKFGSRSHCVASYDNRKTEVELDPHPNFAITTVRASHLCLSSWRNNRLEIGRCHERLESLRLDGGAAGTLGFYPANGSGGSFDIP
jgi:hypothetical protein